MKNVYVFGKNGFVASKLKEELKSKKLPIKFIGSKDIDLTKTIKKISLKKNSIIVFLSAITPDKGKGIDTFRKNLLMLTNLLEALDLKKIIRFIYISSDAVYSLKNTKINDKTKPSPDDLYGLMHLTRENILKKIIDNKKLIILRPTIMYGKGDTHKSYGPNRFVNQIQNDEDIILFGNGKDIRDHLFIGDFIKVLIKSIYKNELYGLFNIASGFSYEFEKIAKIILRNFHTKKKLVYIPNNNKVTKRFFDTKKVKQKFNISFINIYKGLKKY